MARSTINRIRPGGGDVAMSTYEDKIIKWSEVQPGDLILIDDTLTVAEQVDVCQAPWGDGTTFPQVYVSHTLDNGATVANERHGDRLTAIRRPVRADKDGLAAAPAMKGETAAMTADTFPLRGETRAPRRCPMCDELVTAPPLSWCQGKDNHEDECA